MRTIRKIGTWIGLVALVLIAVAVAGYFVVARSVGQRMDRMYSFAGETMPISHDDATIAKGEHIAVIKGCTECHGKNLAGKIMADDPALGRLVAVNLTRGKGGLPRDFDTADWLTVLRHGIDPSGRPLLLMPAHETTVMSKADLEAIIAYCQQIPAVDNELPGSKVGPVATVMTYLGKMPLLPVELIDHQKLMVAQTDTTEGVLLGQYLAVSCSGCHRTNFKGGDPIIPDQPYIPDLTRSGATGRWTQAQFFATLRTGKTPTGHRFNNDYMPWKMAAQYTDKELASLYQYFRSIR